MQPPPPPPLLFAHLGTQKTQLAALAAERRVNDKKTTKKAGRSVGVSVLGVFLGRPGVAASGLEAIQVHIPLAAQRETLLATLLRVCSSMSAN